jgi:hypothetical protein
MKKTAAQPPFSPFSAVKKKTSSATENQPASPPVYPGKISIHNANKNHFYQNQYLLPYVHETKKFMVLGERCPLLKQ